MIKLPKFVVTTFALSLMFFLHVTSGAVDDNGFTSTVSEHNDPKIISYLVGADIGTSLSTKLKHSEIELDLPRFIEGLKSAFNGEKLTYSQTDSTRILGAFNKEKRLPKPVVEPMVSYLLGGDVGDNMKHCDLGLELDAFVEGLSLAFKNKPLKYSKEEHRRILSAFALKRQLNDRRQTVMAALGIETVEDWNRLAAKNREAGKNFLVANAGAAGIKTTASGLQYQIITAGSGAIPKSDDIVKAAYKVTHVDGAKFAKSKALQPPAWLISDQIAGLSEALQLMPVGSKWTLFIPANLGYTNMGRINPAIGPDATLILELELKEIVKPVVHPVQPVSNLTQPIAITFPKRKGDPVKMSRVDPKTGKPVEESKPNSEKKSDTN